MRNQATPKTRWGSYGPRGFMATSHTGGTRAAARFIMTVLFLVLFALGQSVAESTLTLQETARVGSGTVTLGDIAVIDADEDIAEDLGAVVIGNSPLPGRSRTITAGYIRMRLARAGVGEKVVIEGASEVKLTGAISAKLSAPGPQEQDEAPAIPVVTRSQRVKIMLINHGVTISASGRAMDDACLHQPVAVRVVSTGQEIQGIAVGKGQVSVILGERYP